MELVIEGRAFIDGELVPRMIGIENGKICSIKRSSLRGDEHIDLGDRAILPGAIDPHVHFREPGLTGKEDFSTGSLAAVFGGVTCAFDMPNTIPPVISLSALEEKKRSIEKRSWTDYGLFGGCVATSDVHAMGPEVIGFKLFLGSSTGRLLVTDRVEIEHIAAKVKATGKVLSVHAEDENHMRKMEEKDLNDHLKTRPVAAEVSAINGMTKFDGTRINICHISSKEGLQAAVSAGFTKEVTAHHLFLNKDCGKGAYAKTNPPIRTEEDRVALMAALQKGEFDMIGSDHAPHTIEEKEQDFDLAPSGAPGVETTIPMLLALVKKGSVPLRTYVRTASDRPSELFGLNKGRIEIGKDADLTVVDFRNMKKIKVNNLHSKCGWTLFEGMDAIFPDSVFVRGSKMIEDGSIVGERTGRDVIGQHN